MIVEFQQVRKLARRKRYAHAELPYDFSIFIDGTASARPSNLFQVLPESTCFLRELCRFLPEVARFTPKLCRFLPEVVRFTPELCRFPLGHR